MIDSLRKLCAAYWNPIGIIMEFEVGADLDPSPIPADEYDSYLFEVWDMCRSGKGKADIIEYLGRVESDYIGISRPAGDKALFVDKLMALPQE